MEAVGNSYFKFNPIKTTGKVLVAVAMAVWAFGESAGRARAAAELSRQGYHEEARRLMLGDKDV